MNPWMRYVLLVGGGLLYYGIVLPLGLLRRLAGKDPLRQRREANSYWEDCDSPPRDRRDFDPY